MVRIGELILLLSEDDKTYVLQYQPGKVFTFHKGSLKLPENLEFGEALETSTGSKVYVLRPSTADIMLKLKRRTNIIYPREAGYIITHTNIGYGKRVLETGSGSGALTIALANVVGDAGKVYSFERRKEHLDTARRNVERAGLSDRVEFQLLDPSTEGYPVRDVDAAVIDVPEPWTLVGAVHEALKPGGFWASLSPTIEQVIQTVEALKEHGFVLVRTVELFEREILVRKGRTRPKETMIAHIGYLTFARKVKNSEGSSNSTSTSTK